MVWSEGLIQVHFGPQLQCYRRKRSREQGKKDFCRTLSARRRIPWSSWLGCRVSPTHTAPSPLCSMTRLPTHKGLPDEGSGRHKEIAWVWCLYDVKAWGSIGLATDENWVLLGRNARGRVPFDLDQNQGALGMSRLPFGFSLLTFFVSPFPYWHFQNWVQASTLCFGMSCLFSRLSVPPSLFYFYF